MKILLTAHALFGLLALSIPLSAAPESTPESQVQDELRVFLLSNAGTTLWTEEHQDAATQQNTTKDLDFYISQGKEFRALKCQVQHYSSPFKYQGPRKFQLFSKDSSASGYVPFAETLLPEKNGKFVLIIDGSSKPPRILVLPYDAATVGKGKMLVFNATDQELSVAVGKDRSELNPNASFIFNVAQFTDYQMPFEVYVKDQNQWVPCIRTRSSVLMDEQNLGMLYQNPKDSTVCFTMLPQIKPQTEPQIKPKTKPKVKPKRSNPR